MTFLPLYKEARDNPIQARPQTGHAGLWYDKFFNQWQHQNFANVKVIEHGKKAWIETLTGQPAGNTTFIGEMVDRQRRRIEAQNGICLEMELTSPFVTGLGYDHPVENGFLWHHTLGCPYLPGSSLKGAIRAWAESWLGEDKEIIRQAFGGSVDAPTAGQTIFYDVLPLQPVPLICEVINSHIGDWRLTKKPSADNAPADWISPNPIFYLAVKPGARFMVSLGTRTSAALNRNSSEIAWLKDALDYLGTGAKTATGFGRFLDQERLTNESDELADFITELNRPRLRAGGYVKWAGELYYVESIQEKMAHVIWVERKGEDVAGEETEEVAVNELTPV